MSKNGSWVHLLCMDDKTHSMHLLILSLCAYEDENDANCIISKCNFLLNPTFNKHSIFN